jgi:hypothetical protein
MKRISNEIKQKMIQESIDRVSSEYNTTEIYPCGNKKTLDECFTIDDNNIIFWYNVALIAWAITFSVLNQTNQI